MGKSDRIPSEFEAVELCMAMKCDYWTLMAQPQRHLELFKLYLSIKNKVENDRAKKQEAEMNKAKSKGKRRGG